MTLFLLLLAAAFLWVLILGLGLTRAIVIPKRKTFGAAIGRGDPTSPQEAGVSGREVDWTLSDGLPSAGFLIDGQPGTEAGRRRGILVVHGFCDSRFGALHWAKQLVPHAATVAVYDQRAHGDAGGRVFAYGATEAADALAVLEQARSAAADAGAQIDQWVLLGLSAGGGISFRAAAASDAVVGVIADGCYRHWDTPLPGILRSRRYPIKPTIWVTSVMVRLLGVDLKAFDRAGWVAKLKMPMLFLHGEKDHLCPIHSAQEVAAAAIDGGFISFPEAGHLDLQEVDPRKYERALAEYFARFDQP